jgi:ubiquinone/menaquinone biosynthesis C-methylase UbiE
MDKIEQIKKDWDDLAEINAAWFNVPSDQLTVDHEWEIDKFFQSGRSHIKKELELIDNLGIVLQREVALDFGCGIGRITQALAEEFRLCFGVDISSKMIEIAKSHNRFEERCKYVANPATDLKIFDVNYFDFVFSTNALQHNPPEVIRSYLLEFARILKPTGVLMFQIPIKHLAADQNTSYLRSFPKYHPKRIWNKLRGILIGHDAETRYYRLKKLGFSKKWLNEKLDLHPRINMNFLEQKEIQDLLESQGCSIKHVEKYEFKDMIHANFVAVKGD